MSGYNFHVMVDLETMGTERDSVILSIGAVKFEPNAPTGEIIDKFHVGVDLVSALAPPWKRTVTAQTMMWWMHKDRDEARAAWLALEKVDLPTAMEGFAMWLGEPLPMWGNAASFDLSILRSTYDCMGLECPWKFWQENCYRTLKNNSVKITYEQPTTAHDALSDAVAQAAHLQKIFSLGYTLVPQQ